MKRTWKQSTIWTTDTEILKSYVEDSFSLADVLRKLGRSLVPADYTSLKSRLTQEGIDFSRIKLKPGHLKFVPRQNPFSLEECLANVFIKDEKVARITIRRCLKRFQLLPYICDECKMEPIWNQKSLCLQLDHKNGENDDHRLENLRWICPNCHSQTETFCGKGSWKPKK